MPDLGALIGDHPSWAWTALAACLLTIEMLSGSGWLLWPAASAGVVAALVALADLSTPAGLAIFAALTIGTTFLARRGLPRALRSHGHDINDTAARLVGHHGRAVSDFQSRTGRVFIDGKEWAAELADGETIEAGARVEVVGVHGARLSVRAGAPS